MKILIQRQSTQQGTVMLVTLMVAGIIGATLASYLLMTQNQNVSIYRSQTWNSSMAITEAGIEDGLQLINRFAGSFDSIEKWTNYTTSDNWDASANVYHMQRTNIQGALAGSYYDIYVTNQTGGPTLTAVATVPWNFHYTAAAPPAMMFAAVGAPSQTLFLGRSVAMSTKKDALFNVAMAALGQIDLKGNNLTTDSYDSGDPNYRDPVTGEYPYGQLSRTKAGGDVSTDAIVTNSLVVGYVAIKGTVRTAPGATTINLGSNSSIGDRF